MFAKNDEEKRNRLWKTAISVSTLVIILIAVFFVIKLFTSNPLEGTWVREDSDLMLTISGEDQAVVQWPEEFESADVRVSVECSVDTDMKVITLHTDAAELQKAAEESGVDTAKLDTALQKLDGTYEYNLEQKELTLTEREYGSQMTFTKKVRNRQRRWMRGFKKKFCSSAVNLTLFLGRTGGKNGDVEKSNKRNTDWKCMDRRKSSGSDPVYDKYKDRGCGGDSGADSRSGGSGM